MPNINPIVLKTVSGGGGGGINYSVDVFTSSGTYTKPANLDYAYVLMVPGGGGAGSGRRGAANTNRAGGKSVNSPVFLCKFFNADLNATESVTVGAGGAGGAGVTTDNTSGISGSAGGSTNFKDGSNFQVTSSSGFGGSTFIRTGPAVNNITGGTFNDITKIICSYSNPHEVGVEDFANINNNIRSNCVSNLNGGVAFKFMPAISIGGAIRSTNVQERSGPLGGFYRNGLVVEDIEGTAPETNGVQPTEYFTFGEFFNKLFPWFDAADLPQIVGRGGLGGGCGDLAGTVAGGNGADALGYGAGGGGGGASTNGANSGAGGNGSQGIVIIINVLTS